MFVICSQQMLAIKFDKICISSNIIKLINFENTF